jgi:glycerol-3-phosphate dehydrogenase
MLAHDPSRLGPDERRAALQRLAGDVFDVVVVGAGATGAGSALDAVTRGLSVALVEARDFASGTSSRSSKLIHGGLRYLEQRDFALVREALHERSLLLNTLAPHLVLPSPSCSRCASAGSAPTSAPGWSSTTRSAATTGCRGIGT